MPLLFVYGSLKRGYSLNRMLSGPDKQFLGECQTIEQFVMHDLGFPVVRYDPESSHKHPVAGELYSVPDLLFAELDRIEGSYDRKEVEVRDSNNEIHRAFMYIGKEWRRMRLPIYEPVDGVFVWRGWGTPVIKGSEPLAPARWI